MLTSPGDMIRIPLNEDRGETGQIVAYRKKYNGAGIQHIPVGSDHLYDSVDAIAERGMCLIPAPPPAYYNLSHDRVQGHTEPLDRIQAHGILIGALRQDAHPVADVFQDRDRPDLFRIHPAQRR